MEEESIKPQGLIKLLRRKNWINVHQAHLSVQIERVRNCSSSWNKDRSTLDKYFLAELSQSEKAALRDRLAMWWRLAYYKTLWAHQSRFLALHEIACDNLKWERELEAMRKWGAPLNSDIVQAMTAEELQLWRDSAISSPAITSKSAGLVSLHVSEIFFAFEFLAKSVCSASCMDFLYRAICQNSIIQHGGVANGFKRLANKTSSRCLICKFKSACETSVEAECFGRIYRSLIQMRMLRDYREELMHKGNILAYLGGDFFNLAEEALFLVEEYNDCTMGSFLSRPLSFREHVRRLDEQLRRKEPSSTLRPS